MINRLVVFLYLASIGLFSLFWLPCYLGTVGGPPWSFNFYLRAVAECQIPLTIIAALLWGLRWVSRGQSRPVNPTSSAAEIATLAAQYADVSNDDHEIASNEKKSGSVAISVSFAVALAVFSGWCWWQACKPEVYVRATAPSVQSVPPRASAELAPVSRTKQSSQLDCAA